MQVLDYADNERKNIKYYPMRAILKVVYLVFPCQSAYN